MRLAALLLLTTVLVAEQPSYTSDGQLQRPTGVREWIYLSSGLGMQYGNGAAGNEFTNVFAEPGAYREFVKTGKWPERTMLAMEVRRSDSKASINKDGRFQTDLLALEVTVKDTKRFKDGGWEYFAFNGKAQTAKTIGLPGGCIACHTKNAVVENTFGQFYPTILEIARAKGTIKKTAE